VRVAARLLQRSDVRRVVLFCLVLIVCAGGSAERAPAAPTAGAQWPCGLPEQQPLWVDFADGSVPFWESVFARPGIVAAASNQLVPPQLRNAGAKTVYFDLNFHVRMGSPSTPVDPASVQGRADRVFDAAVKSSACAQPVIALNELAGAQAPTPWTPTITRYRANVLAFVQRLGERGARPVLLVANNPFTGEAAADDWWRQVAQVSDVVLEVYFNGPALAKQGGDAASRRIRATLRSRIGALTALGIPPSRLGVMLTFGSTPGAGGRERLQPLSAWLDVVKWEALAAKSVAAETQIASVWSWGWGSWTAAGNDPDKPLVACVWLWTRDPSLCNAPDAASGRGFDASLQLGVKLPATAVCALGSTYIRTADVDDLARLTGDRNIAYSAALQRLVLTRAASASPTEILAAERAVIADRFRGSRGAYQAALQRLGTTVAGARALLGDEIRRAKVEATLYVASPTARQISDFYATYAEEPARAVRATRPLPWLANRTQGVAVAATAPARIFRRPEGATTTIGGVAVTTTGDAAPLAAFPLSAAAPTIRAALVQQARRDALAAWTSRKENQALPRLACAKDDLPQPSPVDLTDWIPFLALS
jgi:hypothetical protein